MSPDLVPPTLEGDDIKKRGEWEMREWKWQILSTEAV